MRRGCSPPRCSRCSVAMTSRRTLTRHHRWTLRTRSWAHPALSLTRRRRRPRLRVRQRTAVALVIVGSACASSDTGIASVQPLEYSTAKTMPATWPRRFNSGPPELPGSASARVRMTHPPTSYFPPSTSSTTRPVVTRKGPPRGKPITQASSPGAGSWPVTKPSY